MFTRNTIAQMATQNLPNECLWLLTSVKTFSDSVSKLLQERVTGIKKLLQQICDDYFYNHKNQMNTHTQTFNGLFSRQPG